MIAITGEILLRDIVLIAAAIAALATIVKYVVLGPIKAFRRIEKYAERMNDAIVTVEAQMKPNGGSSLRDAVDRIEVRLAEHEERLKLLETIDARQTRVEQIVAKFPPPPSPPRKKAAP